MVSYFKTQWWRLVCALVSFIACLVSAYTSTAVADSVDGMYMLLKDVLESGLWFLSACFWMLTSYSSHNSDCIKKLNDRVTELENRAITDVEEVDPSHYVCLRKLGPDKTT